MDDNIKNLPISFTAINGLQSLGFTRVSELVGHNFITLAKKFPKYNNIQCIVRELNPLGYLLAPEDELSIYDIPISRRLQNTLARNNILYLSQLSSYAREEILSFRNLGEKTMEEVDFICEKYNITIRTLASLKEVFENLHFPSDLYLILFKNDITNIDDFNQKTVSTLYDICQANYTLTLKLYYILKKNQIILSNGNHDDKYLFEILSEKEANLLWKKYRISTLSQLTSYPEPKKKNIVSRFPSVIPLIES